MTVVCLGCGPSLTQEDVDHCQGRATVIAINDSYRMAPWADILYAADEHWWARRRGVPDFAGRKIGIEPQITPWPGLEVFQNDGMYGLSLHPGALRTGLTSGYQSINLAVQLGASRIALVGFDYSPGLDGSNHHAQYTGNRHPNYEEARKPYQSLIWPLYDQSVRVVNSSRRSALTAFPRVSLREALL